MSEDLLDENMENAVRDFGRLVSCLEEIIDPQTRAHLAQTIISVVQRIEEEYPDLIDSNFLHHKGGCYIVLDQHEAARDVLTLADELAPDDPGILNSLGYAYDALGQYADARDVLIRADELAQNNPTILNNLGYAYNELGQYETARDVLKQAQELAPDDPGILNSLGYAYIGLDRYADARDVLKRADKLVPDDPGILNNLGYAYIGLGQYADAKGAFKRACALDKSIPHPHLGLACVMDETGGNKGTIKKYLKDAHDRATRENASGNTLMSLWAELNKISASQDAAQKTLWRWSGRPAVNQSTAQTGQPSAPAA